MVLDMYDIGTILIIIGAAFLILRFALYKVSNPFADQGDDTNKYMPQMILLVLLAGTTTMFGIYYYSIDSLAVLKPSYAYTCNGIGSCTATSNNLISVENMTPIATSNQSSSVGQSNLLWLWGFIFEFVVALVLLADALTMMKTGMQNTLEE
jgi:hypothetical protein